MVFSSLLFLFIYLPAVLAAYYVTPLKWRNLVLLIFNLIFYGWGEPVYIVIMFLSTIIDYTHGMLIEKHRANDRKARMFVVSSMVFNLALLFFFKYYDFLADSLRGISVFSGLPRLDVPLPIGISFYTFQTMSYSVDVYRGEAKVQKNIVNFGTFVTLFPQLIAGPILQYRDLDEQLEEREHSVDKFASGVRVFMAGLGKKVLLANSIGMLWDVYLAMPAASLTTLGAWLGVIAFTFQIYFDFSGYSDMAVGLGRMLGFEFMQNFNYPYISRSITEFWRRWHISLGSWFRNYLYIPLGGNRRGKARQYLNLLIVWAATGIWHGASWNFLLWGLYFCALLVIEKAFLLKKLEKAPRPVSHAYALFFIVVGWAIFGVEDLGSLGMYLGAMFGGAQGGAWCAADGYHLMNYAWLLPVLAVSSTPLGARLYGKIPARAAQWITPVLILAGLAVCTAYLVDATYNPFLYFRF
ncbi:MAG: MBOAT family protein [Clostridia bacterium]|nr:MBOAT family protein [Clostridia bacterium]